MNTNSKKHIIVGMSGGVDSSVAALLLKEQGHHVQGMFMKNWEQDDTDSFCPASIDMADAQAVCDKIGIELLRVNFAEEYWERVFTNFLSEYKAGRTPNPDILCNKEIKFKAFLEHAKRKGADFIATGHYAQIKDHKYLLKGLDQGKDQSYFLHALNESQLSQSLFPLGNMQKTAVREIAEKAGLPTFQKKDSTGICFIGERKFKEFLEDFIPAQPGDIVTNEGKAIGKHDGLMFHTLGQRQGLNIGGVKNAPEAPWYVIEKDQKLNRLIVGQGTNNAALFSKFLYIKSANWINSEPKSFPFETFAKTRYRQPDQKCIIMKLEYNTYKVEFENLQRAVTPGQSVVFYDDLICLGGGVILKTDTKNCKTNL